MAGANGWGRWIGRPGRSLTRRLIWLASGWIVLALIITGMVLTNQFQESALRRLGNVLSASIDELVVRSTVTPQDAVVTPQIMDARTLRVFSGKYWVVAEPDGDALRTLTRSQSLYDADLVVPRDLPRRLEAVSYTHLRAHET